MKTHVLLVDGTSTDGQFIRLLLQMGAGLSNTLYHALDLEAALRILGQRKIDVVLIDLPLPGHAAATAVTAVRRRAPNLPLVVLTGRTDQATAKLALEEGAEDSLIKGDLDGWTLVRCLSFAIERNRRRLERESLAAQMAQTDRLAAVGLLAAGIAHEINNPLTYVVGNIDLALLKLRASRRSGRAPLTTELAGTIDGVIGLLTTAAQGADRVRTIVRDVNTFTRPHAREPSAVSVLMPLEWVLKVADKETSPTAQLVRSLAPVPMVLADDARLGQIFLALVLNARDAFAEPDPAVNRISVTTSAEEDEVVVEVGDNGQGIPKEALDRIFEPFFTTKQVGKGSGLGLYVCQNLVRQLGGRLEVESEVGVGTTFRVRLRIAPAEGAPAPAPPNPVVTARLLVLDDDPPVLGALREMLSMDYDVVAVPDTAQARACLDREAFDFVLCDLMLAGGAAMRFFESLRVRGDRMASRLIFMTGGAFSPESQRFLQDIPNPCLNKPFTPGELARAMERCDEA